MELTQGVPTLDDLMAWLVEHVAGYVQRSPAEVSVDIPLVDYGLDSVSALNVTTEIENKLGLYLEATLVWDNPTIRALAGALRAELLRQAGTPR